MKKIFLLFVVLILFSQSWGRRCESNYNGSFFIDCIQVSVSKTETGCSIHNANGVTSAAYINWRPAAGYSIAEVCKWDCINAPSSGRCYARANWTCCDDPFFISF